MAESPIHIFYQRHKSLAINVFSILLFLLINRALGENGVNNLPQVPLVGAAFIIAFLAEPWATFYSMGAFNQRRIEAGIEPVRVHRWMNGNFFMAILFWGTRLALLGVLFIMSLKSFTSEDFSQNQIVILAIIFGIMIREGFVIYYMLSVKPLPNFKESYDFLADIILAVMLVFGQLAVAEIFRDMGMSGIENLEAILQYALVVLFFLFMFYVPIRYIYTMEDFTFARTRREKVERVIAVIVMVLGFLLVV